MKCKLCNLELNQGRQKFQEMADKGATPYQLQEVKNLYTEAHLNFVEGKCHHSNYG